MSTIEQRESYMTMGKEPVMYENLPVVEMMYHGSVSGGYSCRQNESWQRISDAMKNCATMVAVPGHDGYYFEISLKTIEMDNGSFTCSLCMACLV